VYMHRVIPILRNIPISYVQLSDYQPKFSVLSTLKRLNIIRTEPLDISSILAFPASNESIFVSLISESPVDDELCSKVPPNQPAFSRLNRIIVFASFIPYPSQTPSVGPISINRIPLKPLYAFNPLNLLLLSFLPIAHIPATAFRIATYHLKFPFQILQQAVANSRRYDNDIPSSYFRLTLSRFSSPPKHNLAFPREIHNTSRMVLWKRVVEYTV
jgi:hypothetical protein